MPFVDADLLKVCHLPYCCGYKFQSLILRNTCRRAFQGPASVSKRQFLARDKGHTIEKRWKTNLETRQWKAVWFLFLGKLFKAKLLKLLRVQTILNAFFRCTHSIASVAKKAWSYQNAIDFFQKKSGELINGTLQTSSKAHSFLFINWPPNPGQNTANKLNFHFY